MVDQGRKTGSGIYTYGSGKKGEKKVNEAAVKLFAKYTIKPHPKVYVPLSVLE